MLTNEQKKKYLENSSRCPYCGSAAISSLNFMSNMDGAKQEFMCDRCSEEWTDVYKLVDVVQNVA